MAAGSQLTASIIDAVTEKARRLGVYSMMSNHRRRLRPSHLLPFRRATRRRSFFYAMKFDPKNPNSNDGDRSILSKGHAAPLLYAALAEAGVFPISRLMTLRQLTSELEGHPTPLIPGVDAATGSLGQGISVAVGLAIGARVDKSPRAFTS